MLIKQHFVKHFVAPASLRQAEGSCPRGRIIQVIRLMICSDARMRKNIYDSPHPPYSSLSPTRITNGIVTMEKTVVIAKICDA